MWLQVELNHLIRQVYNIISNQTLWRLGSDITASQTEIMPTWQTLSSCNRALQSPQAEKKRLKGMRVYFDLQFKESAVHWSREDREAVSTHSEASESRRGSGRSLVNPQTYSQVSIPPPMLWLQRCYNSAIIWESETQAFHVQPVWKECMVTRSGVTTIEANSYLEFPRFS